MNRYPLMYPSAEACSGCAHVQVAHPESIYACDRCGKKNYPCKACKAFGIDCEWSAIHKLCGKYEEIPIDVNNISHVLVSGTVKQHDWDNFLLDKSVRNPWDRRIIKHEVYKVFYNLCTPFLPEIENGIQVTVSGTLREDGYINASLISERRIIHARKRDQENVAPSS